MHWAPQGGKRGGSDRIGAVLSREPGESAILVNTWVRSASEAARMGDYGPNHAGQNGNSSPAR